MKNPAEELSFERMMELCLDSRRRTYVRESDHLFISWQYDKTPLSEKVWRDKVKEIKLCIPLPIKGEEAYLI